MGELHLRKRSTNKRFNAYAYTVRVYLFSTSLITYGATCNSTQNKLRACPDCSFTTSDPGSLTRHRKRFHGYEPIQPKSKQKDAGEGASGSGSGSTPVHSVFVPELTLPVDRNSFNNATMGCHSKRYQEKRTETPSSTDESFKVYWDYLMPSSVLPSALPPALDDAPLLETSGNESVSPESLFPQDSFVEAASMNSECSSVLDSDSEPHTWMSFDASLLPQKDE